MVRYWRLEPRRSRRRINACVISGGASTSLFKTREPTAYVLRITGRMQRLAASPTSFYRQLLTTYLRLVRNVGFYRLRKG